MAQRGEGAEDSRPVRPGAGGRRLLHSDAHHRQRTAYTEIPGVSEREDVLVNSVLSSRPHPWIRFDGFQRGEHLHWIGGELLINL